MAVVIRVRTTRRWGSFDSIIKTITSNLNRATYDAARGIASSARRRCPVDTGALRESIDVSKTPKGYKVVVGKEYGAYVEYGTRHMMAQPFFRPAVEEYRQRYIGSLKRIVHR